MCDTVTFAIDKSSNHEFNLSLTKKSKNPTNDCHHNDKMIIFNHILNHLI